MTPARPQPDDVEARVWAFEAACAGGDRPDLAAFLPPPDDPHFLAVLRELACVELERAADRGELLTAAHYLARFPALAGDPEAVAALTRQEARAADTALAQADPPAAGWRERAAALYADYRAEPGDGTAVVGALDFVDLILESSGPTDPPEPLPEPGATFVGFRLVRELGRGAFGRVFVAEQTELANRPVALKVGPALFDESRALAQLQHSNVMPIYSAHREGRLQALCMPYLGATTLADVLMELRRGAAGNVVWSTLAARAVSTMRADGTGEPEPPELRSPAPTALDALRSMSHPRAVVWIGAQLADGLAHAHERGLLHRDIKPANVLIADDGTPLLLDFNLSADARIRGGAPAALGGTLPYMAPEHLEAFRGGTRPVDQRSDIYALGVVLFELLTGKYPFPVRKGKLRDQVPQILADRTATAPRAPAHPALGAILAKCLDPDPARRYQTARGLHEDLQRQFDDQPLAHAREPFGAARARKFARRNRRGLVLALVAVLALGAIAAGAISVVQADRTARADALVQLADTREHVRDAEVLLAMPTAEDAAEGERACRAALAPFGLPDRTDWERTPAFANLPPAEQSEMRQTVPRVVFLLARAVRIRAEFRLNSTERVAQLDEALRLNDRALELGGEAFRRHATLQRAAIRHAAGDGDEARRLLAKGQALPAAGDRWLEIGDLFARGQFGAADRVLEEALRAEPSNAALWATGGAVATAQGRHAEAAACYSTVLALRPTLWRVLVWRAGARSEHGDHARARADLDAILARAPDDGPALVLRGIARFHLEDYPGAEADLSRALELGATATRIYFIRARVRIARKDTTGAAADRAEGLKRTPADELSWIARGVARQATDPNGALADFEETLKLNPLSRVAAQNKAAVLSEFLGKPAEAVVVLDALLEQFPDFVEARIGRSVLLARLGKRTEAHADVVAALKLDGTGPTLYRAGCAYALTAKTHPADRAEAFRFVTAALLAGYGAGYVPVDDDLAALKADGTEFARLLKLAAEVRPKK